MLISPRNKQFPFLFLFWKDSNLCFTLIDIVTSTDRNKHTEKQKIKQTLR
jgi:hypothetical protein